MTYDERQGRKSTEKQPRQSVQTCRGVSKVKHKIQISVKNKYINL